MHFERAKVGIFFGILLAILNCNINAQSYLSFEVIDGDTINIIDKNGLKQGIWRTFWSNGDLRSETFYIDGKKKWFRNNFLRLSPIVPNKKLIIRTTH
ncbi:MAG: hypothetical protein KatS3mg027_1779 [Bacteroidia bacterium]|nr:MAG: hypothetical protein KatS3mg027_1779 [Bacteroidia bacterium]